MSDDLSDFFKLIAAEKLEKKRIEEEKKKLEDETRIDVESDVNSLFEQLANLKKTEKIEKIKLEKQAEEFINFLNSPTIEEVVEEPVEEIIEEVEEILEEEIVEEVILESDTNPHLEASLGQLGGECVLTCELDPECKTVYLRQFPEFSEDHFVENIRQITRHDVDDEDSSKSQEEISNGEWSEYDPEVSEKFKKMVLNLANYKNNIHINIDNFRVSISTNDITRVKTTSNKNAVYNDDNYVEMSLHKSLGFSVNYGYKLRSNYKDEL
jgi:hypothetical protein